MKFWGVEIKPNKSVPTKIPPGHTLRVTQVSLGETVVEGRSVLSVTIGNQKHVIASLISNQSEHAVLELMFEEGTVDFSVAGKNSIHMAGNMISDADEDDEEMGGEESEEEEEEEEVKPRAVAGGAKKAAAKTEEVKPRAVAGGAKKAAAKAAEPEDDEDDEEEEDEEDDEEEGDEDEGAGEGEESDEEEEGDDDDDDDDEEEEEEPASKKRPAAPVGKNAAPPAKAQKAAQGQTPKKDAATPAKSAAPATPGSTQKTVPSDVKAKVRQILAGQAAGVKGADFPREWQKAHGTPFKDAFMKLGFKKQGEFMAALSDVVDFTGSGSEVTFSAKKK